MPCTIAFVGPGPVSPGLIGLNSFALKEAFTGGAIQIDGANIGQGIHTFAFSHPDLIMKVGAGDSTGTTHEAYSVPSMHSLALLHSGSVQMRIH